MESEARASLAYMRSVRRITFKVVYSHIRPRTSRTPLMWRLLHAFLFFRFELGISIGECNPALALISGEVLPFGLKRSQHSPLCGRQLVPGGPNRRLGRQSGEGQAQPQCNEQRC